jgi:AcrR family transcriptional regulator
MTTKTAPTPKTRRRGDALEQAIFTAALDIAATQGYAAVTFANVAKAAKTSRSVIYHKWRSPFELVQAAVTNALTHDGNIERLANKQYQNGSLRTDLIELMGDFARRADFPVTNILIQALYAELAQDSRQVTDYFQANDEGDLEVIDRIIDAAWQRGETSRLAARIPRQVRLLPFELIRYRGALLRETVSKARIAAMVDEVVLPLLA